MLTVYNCIVHAHDLRLVGLAAVICLLASFTAISLLHHVRSSQGHMRNVWLAVSATSTGFGIWATHFIAMLAFSPGIPNAYNIALTFLSLIAAIVLTGIGLWTALNPKVSAGAWLGGAMVGGGIAAMHYTGMAAFEIQGRIIWDPLLVAMSIALGGVIGATALPVGLHSASMKWKALGALLLTVAICSHHFTAMAAAAIIPDPTIEVPAAALPSGLLAIAVFFASFVIIVLALSGVAVELRDRRRAELETDRMRGLANAAVEGLLVCDGERIVTVNDSFAALIGTSTDKVVGTALAQYLPEDDTRVQLFACANTAIEGELRKADGSRNPVELILRPIDFAGKPHHAIAVRDLQARKSAEQHIRFLAHHDALTGIPNRSSFDMRLDQEIASAVASGRKLAVLCLDLDRFKEVNDLFGHATGDKVLQAAAKRVGAVLDDDQMLARLSGDEFAILAPGLSNPAAAGRLAEIVLEALKASGGAGEADAPISTSIGVALCPDDATDQHALLTHADTALYRAKQEGRGTYRFFEAAMGAAVHDRRMLEHDLRQAIANKELQLVYQPVKEIPGGGVVGFEALLRWRHPTRGEVMPAEFIPIAEDTGAILPIGEWVLREACREAATWTRPLTVAVNVSTVQIHNANFAHAVHEILFETGLAPSRLELEVTETALVRDLNRALATLRRVKMLGVRIAMDDFGTGYSSLSNLRAFPFDKIKIDQSFIKSVQVNAQAAAIVRSVLGLGRALGLPVLAEGVETTAEFEFLEREKCDEAQGYLLGRPADIATFASVINVESTTEQDAVVVPLPHKTSAAS
ncbi:MAG TPA: EAL domain-containing protein [Xanthobacteraceae bacterium]|nr:EAL domain-containing protein [Xanthobacteraceae bacterium]